MQGLDYSKPLSLYIHVPFCHSKCDYCAFYSLSKNSSNDNDMNRYIDNIKLSIKAINNDYKKPYYTIFIGGGNPGTIGYGKIVEILKLAMENGRAEEVTVELNPEDISDNIGILKPYVTRISVGIQSLNERNLKVLGRNSTAERSKKALGILEKSNIEFNADIMVAIPGESVKDAIDDIDAIASFQPNHISLYCLAFEEDTPLILREKPIGSDKECEILLSCWSRLKELGYEHYEISNFAKKGKESKHNNVYWNLGQYIGLGPTAESSIGYRQVISMRNTEDLFSYIQDPSFSCERLTRKELEEEALMVGLRVKKGIDKQEYKLRFDSDFDQKYSNAIKKLDKSLYINNKSSFSLTEDGMMKLDSIILSFAMEI